jgi:hypothetical protein
MRLLAHAVAVGVGVAAFLVAEALDGEKARSLVASLLPSDEAWSEFLADPTNAFPEILADGEAYEPGDET